MMIILNIILIVIYIRKIFIKYSTYFWCTNEGAQKLPQAYLGTDMESEILNL